MATAFELAGELVTDIRKRIERFRDAAGAADGCVVNWSIEVKDREGRYLRLEQTYEDEERSR